jgi:hypothetical protein
MESFKARWKHVPASIRKPVILTVGLFFVILSPFTGVLPGPGGIPIFLIGIAILATEYEWARRIRDPILRWVRMAGDAWQKHKVLGTTFIVVLASAFFSFSYFVVRRFYQ